MKKIGMGLLVLLGILAMSSGRVVALPSITLDSINVEAVLTGPGGETWIRTGHDIELFMRFAVNDANAPIRGYCNGWKVYTMDMGGDGAATWGIAAPAAGFVDTQDKNTYAVQDSSFLNLYDQNFRNYFSVDGVSSDTASVGGFIIFDQGMSADYDSVSVELHIGPISFGEASHGDSLCVDSCYFPPGGEWLWADANDQIVKPTWDGPHCWKIVDEGIAVPMLLLSTTTMNFETSYGGPNPAAQQVEVTAPWGELGWTATWSEPWLNVTPSSDTTPSTVTVQVDVSSLSPGTYHDSVYFSAPGADNSPQVLKCVLNVDAPDSGQGTVSLHSHEVTCENDLRMLIQFANASGSAVKGFTNGFEVYSPGGVIWDGTAVDTVGTIGGTEFDGIMSVGGFSLDGAGVDTVLFGGLTFFSTGMPNGFDDTVLAITLSSINYVWDGELICIDSTYYPPAGEWLWSTGPTSFKPDWDGPYCVELDLNCCSGVRGNWDGDPNDNINVADLSYAVCYMFGEGPGVCPVNCMAEADYMPDGSLNITDIVSMLWVIPGDSSGYPMHSCCEWVGGPAAKAREAGRIVSEYNGTTTRISLAAEEDLLGVQLRLSGDRQINDLELALPEPWEAFWRHEGPEIKLGILDMTVSATLPSTETTLLELPGEWAVVDAEATNAMFETVVLRPGPPTSPERPQTYALHQNYPNPFNPATTIRFVSATASAYTVNIYNALGQTVAEFAGVARIGENQVVWNGSDQSSGVYFYKLTIESFTDTKKMVLLK